MKARTTREYLLALKNAIISERRQAIDLNLDGMYSAMKDKEEILNVLAHVTILNEEDKSIADEIRRENRRNAFLHQLRVLL